MFSTIDLCLLCLTNNKTLKSILSQDSEGILIEEKYRFVFNESIKIKPEVSYHTCLQCLKNLNDAYNFKQIGLQNISKFNNYVDTLDNNKYLKVTLTNLQNQKKIQLTYNNESANEISSPTEVVRIKEEIAGDCVMQEEEAMYEDDEFSALEKPENMSDNVKYRSSLCEESHIENFLKNETEMEIIPKEFHIKDEQLFEAIEDNWNDKLQNEETNTPDEFSALETQENMSDNVKSRSSLCEESHIENFLKNETEMKIIPEELHIKDEQLFEATEDKWNDKLQNEETNTPDECSLSLCEDKLLEYFSKKVTKENESQLKHEEIPIKDEQIFEVTDSDSENISNDKLQNDEANSPDRNSTFSEGGKNRGLKDQTMDSAKRHKCNQCHKAFLYPSLLQRHSRIHTGERPFECTICNKTFSQSTYLKTHNRMHTGEKPYACEICHKTFSRKSNLTEHEKIHKCSVCYKTFSRNRHLVIHMRTHKEEKPF